MEGQTEIEINREKEKKIESQTEVEIKREKE